LAQELNEFKEFGRDERELVRVFSWQRRSDERELVPTIFNFLNLSNFSLF
jgi:hypothetical protein